MNRRQFIKSGLIGSAVLAAGGAWVVWRDTRDADAAGRDRVALIVGAVAPVLLAGMLPIDPLQQSAALMRVVSGVKEVIAGFPAAITSEIDELFRLLDIGIARRLLTGVSSEWAHADPVDVRAFLERWRTSRIALLQTGYFALHDIVLGAWYADPSTWDALGYPGPPNVE